MTSLLLQLANLGSQSEPQLGTTVGTGVQPTSDLAASTGALGSELETPMTFLGERLGFENTGLSDIPEVMNSAEADDLSFLAFEDYTPTKIQTTQGVDGLSGTTRKVAQYLKGKSSVTPISEDIWVSRRRKNQKSMCLNAWLSESQSGFYDPRILQSIWV